MPQVALYEQKSAFKHSEVYALCDVLVLLFWQARKVEVVVK